MGQVALVANVKDRSRGIGGSDIHHLFSLEPYGCERRLWHEKIGVTADFPFFGNNATERGVALEKIVANMYEEKTNRKLRQSYRALTCGDWAVGHIDRQIVGTNNDGPGVLEIKVPGDFVFRKIKREGLPLAYILQLQHYMLLTGWKWGAFAILDLLGWDVLNFDVMRDDEQIEEIKSVGKLFWKMVKSGEEPDRLTASDSRCKKCTYRTTCQGEYLLETVKCDDDGIFYDPTLANIVDQYLEATTRASEAQEYKENIKNEMAVAIGNRTYVDTSNAKVIFCPQKSKRWDTTTLARECPELAEKYQKESISRPLRIYPY